MWPFKTKKANILPPPREKTEPEKISSLILNLKIWDYMLDGDEIIYGKYKLVRLNQVQKLFSTSLMSRPDVNNISISCDGKSVLTVGIYECLSFDTMYSDARLIAPSLEQFFNEESYLIALEAAYKILSAAEKQERSKQKIWVKSLWNGGNNVAV